MSGVTRLPRSLKMKLVWLVAAFVVVWMNAPADSVGGRGTGVSPRLPTVAAASTSSGVVAAPAAGVAAARAAGPTLEVRLARGEVAESEGVRLGVLAVVDEPVPPAVARRAGERLVWAYVALDNRGTRDVTYTALDLELTDGRELFSSVEGRRGPGPVLTFGVLEPGEVNSGWRIFRVPAGAGPFHLVCSVAAAD
ncbi:MAG: hypothetical protein ACYC33_04930 [Thermoleophilia bacterium]